MALKKILKKDFEEIQNEPIENYYAGIKSDATKARYTRILRGYVMNTLSDLIEGDTFEEKINNLVMKARI